MAALMKPYCGAKLHRRSPLWGEHVENRARDAQLCKARSLRKADFPPRGIKARSAAAHRRAAPRHGDWVGLAA